MLRRSVDEILDPGCDTSQDVAVALPLLNLGTLVTHGLALKRWVRHRSLRRIPFILGDSPLVCLRPQFAAMAPITHFGDPTTMVAFPICPDLALVGYGRTAWDCRARPSALEINGQSAMASERQVFASTDDFCWAGSNGEELHSADYLRLGPPRSDKVIQTLFPNLGKARQGPS